MKAAAANTTNRSGFVLLAIPLSKQQNTLMLKENFNKTPVGSLADGWFAAHGAGLKVVPWTTDNTFCGHRSNAALHTNANDGLPNSDPARWERLLSLTFTVPADSDFVTINFDICTDTEDNPILNVLAYDGALLRVTDLTPGHTVRSVLAEAFEQIFATDVATHYPKQCHRIVIPTTSRTAICRCGRVLPRPSIM